MDLLEVGLPHHAASPPQRVHLADLCRGSLAPANSCMRFSHSIPATLSSSSAGIDHKLAARRQRVREMAATSGPMQAVLVTGLEDPPHMWCIVANVVDEHPYGPGGVESRRGLRIFRPGAKLYVADGFGGMGWETLEVVGQARTSPRYVAAKVRTEHLTNWRVKAVYSPAALRRIEQIRGGLAGFWLSSSQYDGFGTEDYHDALVEVATRLGEAAQRLRDRRTELS